MPLAAKALHNYQPGHDKFYVARVDFVGGPAPYRVVAAWGPAGRPRAQAEQYKGEFARVEQALAFRNRLAREKEKKGYVNVESMGYAASPGLRQTKTTLLDKVDMTRCCNEDGTTSLTQWAADGRLGRVPPAPPAAPNRLTSSAAPDLNPSRVRKIIRLRRKEK